MKTIPLHSRKYPGLVALVDDGDYDLAAQYRWSPNRVSRPGGLSVFYAITWLSHRPARTIRMHKLLSSYERVDHADGNGLNNQQYNMRPVTKSLNLVNSGKRPGLTSQFKGVSWDTARKKWRAQIQDNEHGRHLGRFDSEMEAARAYDVAALAVWGEFARPNFPAPDTTPDLPRQ